MSFSLYDVNGYLSPLASIEGWSDVIDFLNASGENRTYPELSKFIQQGYTSDPIKLKFDVMLLLATGRVKDVDVKEVLAQLEQSLAKAREVAVIQS